MKKGFFLGVCILIATNCFALSELPEISRDTDSVKYAFQELIDFFFQTGSSANDDFKNEWIDNSKEFCSYLLQSLSYENAQKYVEKIRDVRDSLLNSGELSKTQTRLFNESMINICSFAEWELDDYSVPDTIKQKYANFDELLYKKEMIDKINNFQTWEDFFNGKNDILFDLMQIIQAKTGMTKKIDDFIPMKDMHAYQLMLDSFCKSWKL